MMANKYGNTKVIVDGHKFDSIAESKYYKQLKWSQEHKQILFFRLQPRYQLLGAFEKDGISHRKVEYVADFEVHHLDGSIEVIDVKGAETEVFKIKRKFFESIYPHKLTLLTLDDTYGWIETDKLKKLKKQARKVKPSAKKKPRVGAPVSKRRRARRVSL
ncbi:DUF1064 domain-containing protein [Peribacillus asahii]|uniref:DUF1064 domain-containing protein n=1 Tax=Peribacillus asahii TaxID=228899 RepID=UPI003801F548